RQFSPTERPLRGGDSWCEGALKAIFHALITRRGVSKMLTSCPRWGDEYIVFFSGEGSHARCRHPACDDYCYVCKFGSGTCLRWRRWYQAVSRSPDPNIPLALSGPSFV